MSWLSISFERSVERTNRYAGLAGCRTERSDGICRVHRVQLTGALKETRHYRLGQRLRIWPDRRVVRQGVAPRGE